MYIFWRIHRFFPYAKEMINVRLFLLFICLYFVFPHTFTPTYGFFTVFVHEHVRQYLSALYVYITFPWLFLSSDGNFIVYIVFIFFFRMHIQSFIYTYIHFITPYDTSVLSNLSYVYRSHLILLPIYITSNFLLIIVML